MKKVYILMTQWKVGDPEVAGVFSSFDKAVSYFVRTEFKDTTMPIDKMQSEIVRITLKMAHMTDDEDFADFGDTRVWVEDRLIDGWCEAWEKGDEGDGK
jgi:hypothetical protein